MSSRLHAIEDWEARIADSGYQVATLAKNATVSERQLHRFFVRKYGMTPHEIVTKTRKSTALKLLHRGDLVKEVAAHLGFHGSSSFVTTFHKWFGKSPRKYYQQSEQKALNVRNSKQMSEMVNLSRSTS